MRALLFVLLAAGAAPAAAADAPKAEEAPAHLTVQAGSEQGFDNPTAISIPTGKGEIRINVRPDGEPALPLQVKLAPAPTFGFSPGLVAVLLVMVALTVIVRSHKEKPAAAAVIPQLADTPFVIQSAIGRGAMGTVYLAVDRQLDRKVAVKSLHDADSSEPALLEQILKEAKLVAALHHPNIVSIHAVTSQGGVPYIVFEYLEGKTVEQIVRDRGALGFAETKAILDQVCRALEFAHARGVIHRDLKPANVMITALGQVKVMDFGIARRLGVKPGQGGKAGAAAPQLTQNAVGTPLYAAPEAHAGEIRPEGDVYALGVMAYHMLAGRPPFLEGTLDAKLRKAFPPLSTTAASLPGGVDAVIGEALEPDAERRLKTPALFRERFTALG